MRRLARPWPALRRRDPVALFAPLILFIALNVLALAVAYFTGTPRGFLVNADFTMPAMLLALPIAGRSSLHPRLVIAVALFILCAIDLAAFETKFYVTADAISDMSRVMSLWPWKILTPIVMILAAFSAAMARSVPLPSRPAAIGLLFGFLVICGLTDIASGRNRFFQTGDVVFPNVLASATLVMGDPIYRSATSPQVPPSPVPETMAVDLVDPPERILSVALESIGVFKDPSAQAGIMAPLVEGLAGDYRVRVLTTHAYAGGTLSGEVRELCGLRTLSLLRDDESYTALRDCLPNRLARAGYETYGIHGNDSAFYTRSRVYPGMGLQHTLFKDALMREGGRRCRDFIFEGVCDRDAFRAGMALFRPDRKQFVHIMTLDTHFPLPVQDTGCPSGVARGERSLCVYTAQARRLMAELSEEIGRSETKPDLIVLYGDHMPPVSEPGRSRFELGRVPYLELERIQR